MTEQAMEPNYSILDFGRGAWPKPIDHVVHHATFRLKLSDAEAWAAAWAEKRRKGGQWSPSQVGFTIPRRHMNPQDAAQFAAAIAEAARIAAEWDDNPPTGEAQP
jgi:hypothetical protein